MLRSLRLAFVTLLSVSLSYSPVLALPWSRPLRSASPAKTKPTTTPLTTPHKGGELLVKYRGESASELRQQVRRSFSTAQQLLPTGIELLTLFDGMTTNQAVADLTKLDRVVEWVEPNYQVGVQGTISKARAKGNLIKAAPAKPQVGPRTEPAIVAVIDTGVDANHPALKGKLYLNAQEKRGQMKEDDDHNGYTDDLIGWNFLQHNNEVRDENGHGTAMAGIIAALNPEVRLLPLKALDANGIGAVSTIIEAMDYAVAQHASVILYSCSTERKSEALREAIKRAELKGVVVVAAAGNEQQNLANSPLAPAGVDLGNLLTVAATNPSDELADFSNYGAAVHLAAPGVDVLTLQRKRGLLKVTGTSAAAAQVAGIASLLKAERPWVSAQAVKSALLRGVHKVEALQGKVASGGVLDAEKALTAFHTQLKMPPAPQKTLAKHRTAAPQRRVPERLTGNYNLDHTRFTRPQAPDPRVKIATLPPSGYDDPMPTSTANFSAYYTELSKFANDTGIAGSKPMQQADPTAGTSSIGGLSYNLGSRNLNFSAPVVSLPGRAGLNLSLALSYNSLVWTKNPGTSTMFYNADKGFPGPGWRIGFGAMQGINNSGAIGPYANSVTSKNSFIYLQPDGTRRDLAYNSTSQKYESYDSSYLEFDATTKILRTTNGTRITFGVSSTASGDYQFLPTEIKDRNGNFITVVYKTLSNNDKVIDYILDTLGRRIDFYYQSNRLTEIRQDRNGTIFKYAVIDYEAVTINASFTASQDVSSSTAYLPTRVTYPTGVNLRFYYTSYAQIHTIEKWVPTISGQGTARLIAYTSFDLASVSNASYPTSNNILRTFTPPSVSDRSPFFSFRLENAEEWFGQGTSWETQAGAWFSYAYDVTSYYSPTYQEVTEPNTTTKHRSFNDNLVQTMMIIAPDAAGTPQTLKTITNTYTKDSGVSYTANLRPTESMITDQGSSHTRKVGLSYVQQDGIWLVQNKDEYDGNTTNIYRRTTMSYTSYPTQRILGLPSITSVYAGPGTTLLTKSENVYDETNTYQDSNNQTVNYFLNAGTTVQHDDTNYGSGFTNRGNVTSAKQYSTNGTTSRVVARSSYDTNGNARAVADAASNRKTIELTDNFTNKPGSLGATQAYVYTTADSIGMRAGAQYDYYTGLPVKTFALRPSLSTEEQVTTISYDFADRPLVTTKANGATTTIGYWDNLLRQTTTNKIDVISGTDQLQYSWQDFDGAGHVRRQGSDHPNAVTGVYAGQKFIYDNLGRQTMTSNVMAVNGSFVPLNDDGTYATATVYGGYDSPWVYTESSYDALSRATMVQKPDTTYVFMDYNSCGCAGGLTTSFTDENNQRKVTEADFLGRLKYAREFKFLWFDNNGNPEYQLFAEVEYSYDALDRITQITHRSGGGITSPGSLTGTGQTRSFTYDEWGRSASETTPEGGTVSYSYTSNDLVATTTNDRGIVTTASYNTRNLVTGISYNDSGATPSVSYGYDDYGSRTSMSDGQGTMSYTYNSYRQLSSETRTFTGLSGNNYTYNYSYNLAGQLKQVNYVAPSFNKNVNYAYSRTGALTGIGTSLIGTDANTTTNVANSMTYRAFGKANSVTYGNGRKLTLDYSTDLMRMTKLKLALSNGTDVLIDNDYGYTDNGLIGGVWDNVDSTYIMRYTYNFRNQLVQVMSDSYYYNTSSSVLHAYYNYDDWGNYTGATDYYTTLPTQTYNYAKITGTQVPSTNRLSSLVSNGVTTNFTYDQAGNMTAAGSTTYQWDAANRLKSVNSGSLGSYGYDGNGKRVKKTEGGTTVYYVHSSILGAAMEVTSTGIYRAYVMNGGSVVAEQSYDSNFYWVHTDHLGSGRKLTNTSGTMVYRAEFDPWGKLLYEWSSSSQPNLNSKKFTGYERDAMTGLDYAQARMYSSEWARFISPDPIGMKSASATIPQSLNLYAYVRNNPVNSIDPSGLNLEDPDGTNHEIGPPNGSCGTGFMCPGNFLKFTTSFYDILTSTSGSFTSYWYIWGAISSLPIVGNGGGSNSGGEPPANTYCYINVYARGLDMEVSGQKLPGIHTWVILREWKASKDGNPHLVAERYFGGWNNKNTDPAEISAVAGASYDNYYAPGDFQPNNLIAQSEPLKLEGSCENYFRSLKDTAEKINAKHISYSFNSTNSNAVVFTGLKAANLNPSYFYDSLKARIGLGSLPDYLIRGWGHDLLK